jgi:hypothetical protein
MMILHGLSMALLILFWGLLPLPLWFVSEWYRFPLAVRLPMAMASATALQLLYLNPVQGIFFGPLYILFTAAVGLEMIFSPALVLMAIPTMLSFAVFVAILLLDLRVNSTIRPRFIGSAAAICASLVTLNFSGIFWVQHVARSEAVKTADGEPYALRMADLGRHIVRVTRAGGIGGPGDEGWRIPHARLRVADRCYHWSYRQATFVAYDRPLDDTPCAAIGL